MLAVSGAYKCYAVLSDRNSPLPRRSEVPGPASSSLRNCPSSRRLTRALLQMTMAKVGIYMYFTMRTVRVCLYFADR